MFLDRLQNNNGEPSKEIIIELGCGTGGSLPTLAGHFKRVVGLDPSLSSLIIVCKPLEEKGICNVQLVQAYGQWLPFHVNSFNYITAQNVLVHVFEVKEVVSEVWRVFQPDGYFAADSQNLYDILYPEPTVNICWVGFVP